MFVLVGEPQLHSHPPWEPAGQASSGLSGPGASGQTLSSGGPWAGRAGWPQRTGASSDPETQARAESEGERPGGEPLWGPLVQAGRHHRQVDPHRARSPEEGHLGPSAKA